MADENDYKLKYKELKKRLKYLVYEHECFKEELKSMQKKLIQIDDDKSFLLDQLLLREQPSSTSQSTNGFLTDSSIEATEPPKPKRSKLIASLQAHQDSSIPVSKSKNTSGSQKKSSQIEKQLSRKEVEQQLEIKHQKKQKQLLDFHLLPSHRPPEDIFNNDNSNQESYDSPSVQFEENNELIIDMSQ